MKLELTLGVGIDPYLAGRSVASYYRLYSPKVLLSQQHASYLPATPILYVGFGLQWEKRSSYLWVTFPNSNPCPYFYCEGC
jgi:hypothetical protein